MRTKQLGVFTRISILLFAIIAIISLMFTGLTYLSVSNFHEASTQLLNKDVAAHIAKFTSPFTSKGIDSKKADSVFYDAMVLSPSVEVYFLDSSGNVIAYHANENKIRQKKISLSNIKALIASQGTLYIKGPDPRDPVNSKIFSAAEVWHQSKQLGYIYVILGSNRQVNSMLFSTYFSGLVIKVLIVIILLSVLVAFFYINRLRRSYNTVLSTLEQFKKGDFNARFKLKPHDEMEPITTAFNALADLLVINIDKLTKAGKERKDFIANISHDLRTPLSVARGYTETLMMTEGQSGKAGDKEEYLHMVYKKIRQVEDMVLQLFDLSKMESAEFVTKKEPFVFSEILQEIIHESYPAAKEKNIMINTAGIESAAWISGDIGLIERLVQNLLVNALKFTPAGGQITVALFPKGDNIIFEIANTGSFADYNIVNWFNDTRDDILLHRPAKMGLGLVIIKKILMLHGYSYTLTTVNNYNTFSIAIAVHNTSGSHIVSS